MRSRASVPIAENISAYLTTCSVDFFEVTGTIFRYLQKYGLLSSGLNLPELGLRAKIRERAVLRAFLSVFDSTHNPWKVASLGVPVVLVYLGSLNADEMSKPFANHEAWEPCLLAYAEGTAPLGRVELEPDSGQRHSTDSTHSVGGLSTQQLFRLRDPVWPPDANPGWSMEVFITLRQLPERANLEQPLWNDQRSRAVVRPQAPLARVCPSRGGSLWGDSS